MTRTTRLAAALFAVGVLVVQPFFGGQAGTTPAGTHYDAVNRGYAVVLAVLVWLCVLLRRRAGGAASVVCVVASAAACAGVVLEFWIGMLQDRPLSADAQRAGLPDSAAWWGSDAGFWLFAAGAIVLAVAGVVWAVRADRRGTLPRAAAVALGITGPLVVVNFGLTNYGPLAAAAGGIALAVPWLVVAAQASAGRSASSRRGARQAQASPTSSRSS
jgi:hypothetical protein